MAYTNPRIAKMHQAKMFRYDRKDIGMSLGASMNKAVDIVVAEIQKADKLSDEDIKKRIEYWRDWIFEAQDEKMKEELMKIIPIEEAEKHEWGKGEQASKDANDPRVRD